MYSTIYTAVEVHKPYTIHLLMTLTKGYDSTQL